MIFQEKKSVHAVKIALSVMAGSIFIASQAQAQQTDVANDKIQRVVVTGSNISRVDMEGPTPIEVVKRADIAKSGASTVIELLSKLPSISVALDGNSSSTFASGASSAALRGLDSKYTLILLNGRRLANYGFAIGAENSFVDLNSLPLSAIESVEILRDGASAIYGSDAVAGVINFKTRTNYQGVEGTANIGANQKGDGQTGNVSLTSGWGDLEQDGRNLLLTLDLYRRNPLVSNKHSNLAAHDFRKFGGSDNRKTNEYMGWIRNQSSGDKGYVIPGCQGTVGVSSTGDNVCFTNPASNLTPRQERAGISTIFTQRLNSSDELFLEAAYTQNSSTFIDGSPNFSSANYRTAGSTNPGLATLPDGSDGSVNGFMPGDLVQVFRSVYEAGKRTSKVTSKTTRVVGGWRGTLGKWDSEGAISLNQNKLSDDADKQSLLDKSTAALQAGLLGKAGGYDPFILNNPESAYLPFLTTTSHRSTSKLSSAEWKMSTPELFSLAGEPVGFAWGLQGSHESIDDVADPQMTAGNIVNFGATSSKASRTVYSIYGELNVPIAKQVEMQLALRGDHYSDFGNSYNPKVALAWRPNQQVMLRGSATTSFKAPTLPEIASTTTAYSTVADWARCGPLGYTGVQCSYSPKVYLSGNPDLKAEKAKNFSLGIVLQPIKDLSASLDWYSVRQKDTIQTLDAQYVLDHEDTIPGFAALIGRDPRNPALEAANPGLNKGRIKDMTLPFQNVGKTNVAGLDLDVKYSFKVGEYGTVKLRESNSYNLKYEQSIAPGSEPTDRLDGINHPKWSNTLRIGFERNDKEVALTARTRSSTKNIDDPTKLQDAAITNKRIGAFTAWDMNVNFKPVKDLDVSFGVNNMFDKGTVYANSAYVDTYVNAMNDIVGRYIYLNARYKFK
ncbi:TonB-dependent receptor [Janthinobacterium sp. BJB401]|uniref:TonB-dependent receptor n=1 Tax=Janthinobacterium sp. BJB401 TaxID=2745934 RepID=UPI0015951097|nr:TonB-dependent receptor [Janthinobacterium sp. BJB401]NVI81460.1 TonB-dependent receptor [Janthinobacterium sp. BJB401]